MMCDREKIYLYLELELSEAESAQMEAHLQECAECANRLHDQRAMLADLDGLLDVSMPGWLGPKIIEQTYEDVTATLQRPGERRRALMAMGALSTSAVVLLSLNTVADYLLQFFTGLQVVGSVSWDVITVFLKGLSFIAIGLVHGLADDAPITPIPAILVAVTLTLVLVRLVLQYEVSTNKR
jgi:predicted anti-sigma-YlaC factor YlaD